MKHYLYAITLPQAPHLAITAYKKMLFKTFGAVSALALPPLIPLGWSSKAERIASLPPLPKPQNCVIPSGSPKKFQNGWFLSVEPAGSFHQLKQLIPNEPQSALFPDREALFIAADEPSLSGLLPQSPNILSLDDFRLKVFALTCNSEVWYKDIFYSVIDEVHLL
ncbi:MAG: hypothetical protein ACQEQU_03295 [Spirochaetota bacterium]